MGKKKSNNSNANAVTEQLKKVEKTFAQIIKSNEKLKNEIERMKELMNYTPGSSSKK